MPTAPERPVAFPVGPSGRQDSDAPLGEPPLADFYPLKRVPDRLPARPNGRRLHPKVPGRWAWKGLEGHKLRVLVAGRQVLTCDKWLFAFLEAVACAKQGATQPSAPAPVRSAAPAPRRSRREETRTSLKRAGFRVG